MQCQASTGRARIDPLVSYGEAASGHSHVAYGGGGFSSTSSYDELLASDCTSCMVPFDKSAYWAPDLWFHGEDGLFSKVNQTAQGGYGLLA